MDLQRPPVLADPQLQATLLAEAMGSAEVGVVVWDDDRHYVAANAKACELIGCTLEELLGTVVGSRTSDGDALIDRVTRSAISRGTIAVERYDGSELMLEYVTFATRTAGLPYMASVIWPAED